MHTIDIVRSVSLFCTIIRDKQMARSTCNNDFASDYFLLDPEKVGIFDLFHILFSKDLGKREFIDCSSTCFEECIKHRWIIFASIVVQKLLLLIAKPMARFGFFLEHCFNLIYVNHGIFGLIDNYFRGKTLKYCVIYFRHNFKNDS